MFAVVRHPDVQEPGIIPDGALEFQRERGWYRVSEWHEQPDFHLPDYAQATEDLDAQKPSKTRRTPADAEEQ